MFLGLYMRADELLLGTSRGTVNARMVRRRRPEAQRSSEAVRPSKGPENNQYQEQHRAIAYLHLSAGMGRHMHKINAMRRKR